MWQSSHRLANPTVKVANGRTQQNPQHVIYLHIFAKQNQFWTVTAYCTVGSRYPASGTDATFDAYNNIIAHLSNGKSPIIIVE